MPPKKQADTQAAPSGGRDLGADVVPSPLDEASHAECRALYAESTETLRFVKSLQWKTVGSTLLVYLGMVVIASLVDADLALVRGLKAIGIVLALAALLTLIVYQFWMHNELAKIARLEAYFSSVFRKIRAVKSKREGNIHRYTLLLFMILATLLGAVVLMMALDRVGLVG